MRGTVPSPASHWPPPPSAGRHHEPRDTGSLPIAGRLLRPARPTARRATRWLRAAVDAGMHADPGDVSGAAGPRQGGVRAGLLVRGLPPGRASGAGDRRCRRPRPTDGRWCSSPTIPRGSISRCWADGSCLLRVEGRGGKLAVRRHHRAARAAPCSSRASAMLPGGSGTCCASGLRPATTCCCSRRAPHPTDRACCRSAVRSSRSSRGPTRR